MTSVAEARAPRRRMHCAAATRLRGEAVRLPEHVLFVVSNYPPHLGGVEFHVQRLAVELVASGHRVTVLTTTTGADVGVSEERGVAVIRIPGRVPVQDILSFPAPGTARRIRSLCRQRDVTVVSTHTRFFPMSFVGARAAARAGIAHVHTEHGSDHVRGVGPIVGLTSRLVDRTIGRRVLRSADAVLAVSDRVQTFVRRLSGREAIVFPNAIDIGPWLAARPSRPRERRRLVFLGRLVPGKGWDDFITTAALLRDRGFEFDAEIIGDGSDRPSVEVAVKRERLDGVVAVRGRVVGADLARALAGSTLVNATRLAEGFQTSLIESVAAGGDVVTYPIAGASTLAEAGAPVCIVAESTPAALATAIAEGRPGRVFDASRLAAWDWQTRARDYATLLASVRAERARVHAKSRR
ncbi:glycosyltransferase family 4 protein [Agromyces larvae]|uniref:Glycosyltransferase family 4 protein n=1 Tax=Agromyces larvae TaxID=2929802 RepID=A0ABY4BZE7_9MICO|nr:glycosyltransferase family 4 protein [Agromyces larvae]UOE44494.1 glycosyltransferase family 4 protein [Agromyces larvae]